MTDNVVKSAGRGSDSVLSYRTRAKRVIRDLYPLLNFTSVQRSCVRCCAPPQDDRSMCVKSAGRGSNSVLSSRTRATITVIQCASGASTVIQCASEASTVIPCTSETSTVIPYAGTHNCHPVYEHPPSLSSRTRAKRVIRDLYSLLNFTSVQRSYVRRYAPPQDDNNDDHLTEVCYCLV